MKKHKKLKLHGAIDLMRRRDARMIQTNTDNRVEHWITPGVYIDATLAAQIKAHPQVEAGKDSLFPGLDQTWRLMRG
jgi:hypothetical protein